MDPITIGLLAGAGLGALKGNANVKKEAENDRYRKVAVAMSPWTGQGDPGALNLGGPLESAASGAALGGQVGGMMGKMGAAAPAAAAAPAPVAPQGMAPYQGMNSLGGQDMSAQLGQQYGMPGSPGALGNYKYSLLAQGY